MTEAEATVPETVETIEELRARAQALERQLEASEAATRQRVMAAELKMHAIRAGMVDLDGLRLVDTSGLSLSENDVLEGASALMSQMKQEKPWLFGHPGTSPAAMPPPVRPPAQKRATEMSHDEWREARSRLLVR